MLDGTVYSLNRFADSLLQELETVSLTRPEDNEMVQGMIDKIANLFADIETYTLSICELEEQDWNEQESKRRYAMYAL